jgi:hypothetical protein
MSEKSIRSKMHKLVNDVTLIIARDYVYALDFHGKPPER